MRKITKWGMNVLLATDLAGASFFEELLSKMNLEVDENGNIVDHCVDNIKKALKVAIQVAIEEKSPLTAQIKKALLKMLDYGTEESSFQMREFLQALENGHSPSAKHSVIMIIPAPKADNQATPDEISEIHAPLSEQKYLN